jgi:hypothetical protein
MAKVKVKKSSKTSPKKTLTIKKPQIKLSKIKFSKPDFKNLKEKKSFQIFAIVLGGIVVFILVDFLFQYLNNGYSIAVVDGVRIPRQEFYDRMEKQYGQSIAQQLIDEEIIKIEAQKADVTVTDEEIQDRLDEIISSIGGEDAYNAALISNNITEEELKSQIELDLLLTKMVEPTLEYTEDDVKAFFEQYSSAIYPNETAALEEGEKLDYEQFKEGVEEIYVQQQVENERYTWLETLYDEYKIQNNTVAKPQYGILSATINIFSNLLEEANSNDEETTEIVVE